MIDEQELAEFDGTQTVRFERLLPGPIERLWSYLADSDKRSQWFAAGVLPTQVGTDFSLHFDHASLSANPEPTPERFKEIAGGLDSHHRLTRFDPPHALGFSWGTPQAGLSEVTFELTEAGDQVRLVLTHRRLSGRDEQFNVAGGWHAHLEVLRQRLNDRLPESFWNMFFEIERAYQRRDPPA